MPNFQAIKMIALNDITRKIETLVLNTQKNPYLNQAIPKKILAKIFLPPKNPEIENFKPKKIL